MTSIIHSIDDEGAAAATGETPAPMRQASRAEVLPSRKANARKPGKHQETARQSAASKGGPTKTDMILKLLRRKRGITLAELVEATGWQAHSVRGFLSGTVRKKLGLSLVSDKGQDGALRYRIGSAQK